jgi:hypothetical protein
VRQSNNFIDETGNTFGRLTVLRLSEKRGTKGQAIWICQCSCKDKTICEVFGSHLRRTTKPTRSCGCLRKLLKGKECTARNQHGKRCKCIQLPEYSAFNAAKGRCRNPKNKSYKNYGARGIEFRFTDFLEFVDEVGYRPTSKHSLDRKNNNGHYEKGNVRWATKAEQANNRRGYHQNLLDIIAQKDAEIEVLKFELDSLRATTVQRAVSEAV